MHWKEHTTISFTYALHWLRVAQLLQHKSRHVKQRNLSLAFWRYVRAHARTHTHTHTHTTHARTHPRRYAHTCTHVYTHTESYTHIVVAASADTCCSVTFGTSLAVYSWYVLGWLCVGCELRSCCSTSPDMRCGVTRHMYLNIYIYTCTLCIYVYIYSHK